MVECIPLLHPGPSPIPVPFSAGLETAPRLALTHNQSLQSALASQAAALRQHGLGGSPLILSPRLQGLQVPTTLSNGLLSSGGPPPLINPNDTQQLLYAHYGLNEYTSYPGLTNPLIDYATDTSGNVYIQLYGPD